MDPNYSYFVIDKHLKRFESALNHIALCQGEECFEECLNLIKTHKLHSKVSIHMYKCKGKLLLR
jgi:elongator complex protein 1